MKDVTNIPLTLVEIDHPDGWFYDIGLCLGKIVFYFAIDADKPLYGLVCLDRFLDVCIKEGLIVDYNLEKHLVYEPKGVDDYRTRSIQSFCDWFAGEDIDGRTQQDVIRQAAREEIEIINAKIAAAHAAH